MASLAQAQVRVPLAPTEASHALAGLLPELGYELVDTVPGDTQLLFARKRTLLWVARQGGAQITEADGGSLIELGLDDAPGQPVGLLDGKHNRGLVAELTEQIGARLGSV